MVRTIACLCSVLVFCSARTSFAQDVIDTCGATTSNGILSGDLDCSGAAGSAVLIAPHGRLDLAGFTLTGSASAGVGCLSHCTIEGTGGSIVGSGGAGVVTSRGRVAISNVMISGNAGKYAVGSDHAGGARLELSNVDIVDNANFGAFGRNVEIRDSTVTGHRLTGVVAKKKATVQDSTLSFNGRSGVAGRIVKIAGSTLEGNGSETPSGGGATGRSVRIENSSLTNNHYVGVFASRVVRASLSAITGNDVSPDCSSAEICADIISGRSPKLANVTCGTSAVHVDGEGLLAEPWGVCALD